MIPNQKTHVTTQATRRGSHGRGGAAQRTNGTSAAANSGNNNNNSNQGAEQRALFLGRSFYLDLRSAPEVRKNIHFGIEALKGVSVCAPTTMAQSLSISGHSVHRKLPVS